jgi:tetratricopeptide (TPR) repeat protein
MLRLGLLLIVFVCIADMAYAQKDDRKTEKDIVVEYKFLNARLQLITGKQEDALKILDTLRKENRDNAAIVYEMAKIHAAAGNIGPAEEFFLQAMRLEPQNIWYKEYYAGYMVEIGKFSPAADVYRSLILANPKNTGYHEKLTDIYIRIGAYSNAISTLTDLELQTGFSEQIIYRKAEILDNTGNTEAAVSEIQRLIKKYPGQIKYYKIAANILRSAGMDKEAMPFLKKILEMDPSDPDATIALLAESNSKANTGTYIVSLYPLLKNAEVGIDVKVKELLPFVVAHSETADPMLGEKLRNACEILVSTHPNEPKAHAIAGDVLMNSGEITAAVRHYERTIELNDRNYMVWEQWMHGLERLQRFDELYQVAERALDVFPNFPMPYYFAGVAALAKKEINKAENFLDDAYLIAADDHFSKSKIACTRAELNLLQKKYKQARIHADEALSLSDQKNLKALELLGDIYFAESNFKEALAKWKEALAKGSKSETLIQKIENSGSN